MNRIRQLFDERRCILEGDFFFALKKEGLVAKKYINTDPIFTDPVALRLLVRAMLTPFIGEFKCLVGPAVGGIPLIYTASMMLQHEFNTRNFTVAFPEKVGTGFRFDRMNFEKAVTDREVLILEDITTTGETTRAVADLITKAGGQPCEASLAWNRGKEITPDKLGVRWMEAQVTESVETWWVKDNPPGWGDLPLVSDIGHPEYYPDYPGERIKLLTI